MYLFTNHKHMSDLKYYKWLGDEKGYYVVDSDSDPSARKLYDTNDWVSELDIRKYADTAVACIGKGNKITKEELGKAIG